MGNPTSADDFLGKVVGVADGDTVTVLRGKEQVKVRTDGIDAPEKNQSFGSKSKDALAGLVFGKTVTVQSRGTDRYGRTLGVISVGDTNVNQKLVADGWAWHYKQYSSDQTLARSDPPSDRRCRPLPAMAVTDSTCPSGFATP
ncbi:MAG: thermonuclease family protein, partial [Planctomycetaceae bacterium]